MLLKKNIILDNKRIIITGCAGFIGSALTLALLKTIRNVVIIGIDNLNNYYDVSLKMYRLSRIHKLAQSVSGKFIFIKEDISDQRSINSIFDQYLPQIIVNLAAQAGVRYSIDNPNTYIESNIVGFFNIVEACRHSFDNGKRGVEHLVFASSSSVYGNDSKIPYAVEEKTDSPVSLYAATKKMDEILSYSYAKLYEIPTTGLRFFTVYGPAGRPDMAYYKFTEKMLNHEKIKIFNYGKCKRDFTYIDDIVAGIIAVMQHSPLEGRENTKYKIYNIGNNEPVDLLKFVDILQQELKLEGMISMDYDISKAIQLVGMQPGDVEVTCADISELERNFGFKPTTDLRSGLRKFVQWYHGFIK